MIDFYINNKKLSCLFLLMLWSLSLIGLLGCSSTVPREVQVVSVYQSMGATLEEAKPAILSLCATGALNNDDCSKAISTYNIAVAIYKAMSVEAEIAIETGDDTHLRTKTLQLQEYLIIINQFLITQ